MQIRRNDSRHLLIPLAAFTLFGAAGEYEVVVGSSPDKTPLKAILRVVPQPAQ